MLTNPRSDRVRSVRGLSRRAARLRAGRFVVEGPQGVREAVRFRPESVVDLYVAPDAVLRHADLVAEAAGAGLVAHEVSAEVLSAMADTEAPQGLLAVCTPIATDLDSVLGAPSGAHTRRLGGPTPRLLVVLAHVRDPGNAGTVIRCADAAGADAVVVTDASVDVYNPKVVRSSAGSIFHVPLVVGVPVEDVLDRLRAAGIRLLAADGAGQRTLAEADVTSPHAWIMGNEAWGLAPQTRSRCDDVIRVPIYGAAESLNLAMAATVCLYASAGALAVA